MKFNKGMSALPSVMGTTLSFLSFFIVAFYTYQKVEILIENESMDISLAVKKDHFQDDFKFTSRHGFNVAVALTSWGNE